MSIELTIAETRQLIAELQQTVEECDRDGDTRLVLVPGHSLEIYIKPAE